MRPLRVSHKNLLEPRLITNLYFCLLQAADDVDAGDKELMAKLFGVALKCFKDADWGK